MAKNKSRKKPATTGRAPQRSGNAPVDGAAAGAPPAPAAPAETSRRRSRRFGHN